MPHKRSVQRDASNVMPQRPGLIVSNYRDPVVEAFEFKGMGGTVDERSQTDSRVADCSEGDHPGLAVDVSLGNVMVGHLVCG